MAHHGSDPFDGFDPERKASREKMLQELMMGSAKDFRGALGDFPEGQLTKSDEGAIQFAIGEKDGKIVIEFGTPVAWLGLNPQQAADLASLLLKRAREVGRKNGQTIGFTIG